MLAHTYRGALLTYVDPDVPWVVISVVPGTDGRVNVETWALDVLDADLRPVVVPDQDVRGAVRTIRALWKNIRSGEPHRDPTR
ncbi:hypothetical protein C8K30_11534 [Promicromonospora sp. AC04]|uniref:hypothetical protein n=1 Tax=Promicromonospora sp. AC04 TaxID=2135723 RepID=UPI000D36C03C|nr:hypothetical protein [Promicromonospora sp. AC04]PUB20823.1 hypothetical protein C8K30_11534 [Promicromonospora sp. AC04]